MGNDSSSSSSLSCSSALSSTIEAKVASPSSSFNLIFKTACLLLACLTLSVSQFQKPAKQGGKRSWHSRLVSEYGASTPLAPASSSALVAPCSTPLRCYCHTLYAILRVPPNADFAQIRSSYRHLAKRFHPDKRGPESNVNAFELLQQAYDVLNNEDKRKKYDEREGLLDWRNEKAQEEEYKLNGMEETQMENTRKFRDAPPLIAPFDNFHCKQQQQHSPLPSLLSNSSRMDSLNRMPLIFDRVSLHGVNSSTGDRSLLLYLLAYLRVLAQMLMVLMALPITYFFWVLPAHLRKSEWSEDQHREVVFVVKPPLHEAE